MNEIEKIIFLRTYTDSCPVCDFKSDIKSNIGKHIRKYHTEYKHLYEYDNVRADLKKKDSVECPICNKEFIDLTRHVKIEHSITSEDFKVLYPTTPIVVNRKYNNVESVCSECGKKFNRKNELIKHMNKVHKQKYDEIKEGEASIYNETSFTCPICNVNKRDMKQHVMLSHNLEWDIFCSQYNWESTNSKFITDEYRKNLSVNKQKFYDSERGEALKNIQSIKFKGDGNISKSAEVRYKLSKQAINRMDANPFFNKSYGIKFMFTYENVYYSCRSFEEMKVLMLLLKNNIEFEYEKTVIKYNYEGKSKNYILDFKINDKFIEIKSYIESKLSDEEKIKYENVRESLDKLDTKLYIVTYEELKNMFNLEENYNIHNEIKKMLSEDTVKITYYTYRNNSRVLYKIDKNYKENKNITFVKKESKNAKVA